MWAKCREIRRNRQYPEVTKGEEGHSLAVQLLGLCASTAVGMGQSLVWERISHTLCSVAKIKKKKERKGEEDGEIERKEGGTGYHSCRQRALLGEARLQMT